MIFLKYFVLPFLFGSLSYLYSRWVISRKQDRLIELLIGLRNLLNLRNIMAENDGWNVNSKYILESLKRIEEKQEEMEKTFNKEITSLKIQVATLNVKSGIFGFVGSALAIVIALGITYLKSA